MGMYWRTKYISFQSIAAAPSLSNLEGAPNFGKH